MGFFSFMETSFFFTLGITFLLILLLVYHFKQRIVANEAKQDQMFELINNIVQEINNIKTSVALMNRPSTPYPHNLQNTFTAEQQYFQENNEKPQDEPEEESYEDYSDSDIDVSENDISDDEIEEDDEKIIVSDNDDISVEEISIEENLVENATMGDPEPVNVETMKVVEGTPVEEKKPDFNKMNLGNLKAYILEQGWVEDASKMKKAQILSLIQERVA